MLEIYGKGRSGAHTATEVRKGACPTLGRLAAWDLQTLTYAANPVWSGLGRDLADIRPCGGRLGDMGDRARYCLQDDRGRSWMVGAFLDVFVPRRFVSDRVCRGPGVKIIVAGCRDKRLYGHVDARCVSLREHRWQRTRLFPGDMGPGSRRSGPVGRALGGLAYPCFGFSASSVRLAFRRAHRGRVIQNRGSSPISPVDVDRKTRRLADGGATLRT